MARPQDDVVLLLAVRDLEERGRLARGLERVRDDRGDELPVVGDLGALEEGQLGIVDLGEPRRVAVPQHGEHAGHPERGGRVDVAHLAAADRRRDGNGVCHPLRVVLVGVGRLALHLVATLEPFDGLPDGASEEAAHAVTSASSASVRTTRRRTSGSL